MSPTPFEPEWHVRAGKRDALFRVAFAMVAGLGPGEPLYLPVGLFDVLLALAAETSDCPLEDAKFLMGHPVVVVS